MICSGENNMNQENKTSSNAPTMELEIQGHKVTLCFTEKADPEIAIRIKKTYWNIFTADK